VPTRIHAILRLKFTNMETAMLSITSARTVSVYQFTKGLGVERGVGAKLPGVCVRVQRQSQPEVGLLGGGGGGGDEQ